MDIKIIFLVVTSKTHIHKDVIEIDRADLTRKLDCINTWVEDVLNEHHEVIFFEGGNDKVFYDESSKTLYLEDDDSYDSGVLSTLFLKVKSALEWVYKNKEFDFVYLMDDDIYVNYAQFKKIDFSYDYIGSGAYGGGGFFFNKHSIQTILNYTNTNFRACDQAIFDAISKDNKITKFFGNNLSSIFYVPGELYATVHYVSGKRSYFLHNILKYFNEHGYTNRKIILGGPLSINIPNRVISYESTYKRKTKRWYDFTTDPNGWEYHGCYTRSDLNVNTLKNFWPYAERASKFFVINYKPLLHDYIGHELFEINLNFLIENCKKSLIDENNLLLCSKEFEQIDGWVLDNSVKDTYKLNFELLNEYNFYRELK